MKKRMSIVICLVAAVLTLLSLSACGSSSTIQEDWSTIIVGDNLPTPQKGDLRSGSNLDNMFSGAIEDVDAKYYTEYKQACIDKGYTVDSEENGNRYEAFNADGYDLSLYFDGEDISVILIAPEELSEFEWPATGIGSKLPTTVSSLGKITSDSSDCFRATVGNTTIDDYNEYVQACEQSGFIVDYTKQDNRYEAKDADGYRLILSYIGCNRIDVMIQTPKQEDATTSATSSTNEKSPTNERPSTDDISQEFKAAMDSYEKFFNEYVAFMKKYSESNGTDLSLLTDYSNYMSKYVEVMQEFEEWNGKDLNAAETAYYVQVQSRINQKLLEVAQ